ncbi:MAG TPA: hypothetical protein VJ508_10440 [Saprospiraceae bacterium]|nr:hypothetical protein [Saprospiraceae bacterium]
MKTKRFHLALFISFLLTLPVMYNRINHNPRCVLWSDAEGYYKYLPAIFLLKDVHKMDAGSIWPTYNTQGEFVDKYTCGVAYFELPFFGIGYVLDRLKRGNKKWTTIMLHTPGQ